MKNGWKPRRTLLYASWDAEEYGLVGSTEWAEENRSSIHEKAVLLLNVDSAVSGPEFGASGVPSLRELVLDAAGAIIDPRTGKSLRTAWTEAQRAAWAASAPLVLTDPVWDSTVPGDAHRESHGPAPMVFFLNWARSDPALITPRFSTIWPCRHRRGISWRIWGLPLHLRQLQLDGEIR